MGQGVELAGEGVEVGALGYASCGVHQQLQGRESLLPVDDVAGREMTQLRSCAWTTIASRKWANLPKGSRWRASISLRTSCQSGAHWVLLIPHLRPLEQRHHQLLRQIENLHGSAHRCFHRDILPRDTSKW